MKKLWAVICVCAIFFPGCAYASNQKFAESFLDKMRTSDYQGMYLMLHPEVTAKVPYYDFRGTYAMVAEKLGAMKGYKMSASSSRKVGQGTLYQIAYKVDFEKAQADCMMGVFVQDKNMYITACDFSSEGLKMAREASKTFTERSFDDLKLSLSYPDNFVIERKSPEMFVLIFTPDMPGAAIIFASRENNPVIDAPGLIGKFRAGLAGNAKAKMSEPAVVKIGDREAYKVTVNNAPSSEPVTVRWEDYYIVSPKRVYMIRCQAPDSKFDDYKAVFERIVNSFKAAE